MAKSCKKGYYYCFTSKRCKKIPKGYHVMTSGRLMKDSEHEEKEETKNNGNGTNGAETGNGSSDGGGVSEGWSVKYKKSIDCDNPKGFSQRAHCQGRKKVNEEKKEGCDHEVVMARKQVKKSMDNLKKLARVLAKKSECEDLPAWVQAKLTDTEHNTDAAASYMEQACPICNEDPCQCLEGTVMEGKRDGKSAKDKDYSLHDWFKGGGWVQAGGKYDGKPCAKQPGQKTKPFCRDADDRAAMSKEERNKRAKKKRKEDPNPNRKGKAKMVRESNWREELQEKIGIPTGPGTPFKDPDDAVKKLAPKYGGGEVRPFTPVKKASIGPNFPRTAPNTGEKYQGLPSNHTQKELERNYKGADRFKPILQQAHYEPEGEVVSEKKDACYKKVKARYDVWPSAYASGALVKCRKVGAANWGNKTKKESYDYSNWRDDFKALEIETIDLIKPEPLINEEGGIVDTVKSFLGLARDKDMKVKPTTPMGQTVTGLQNRRQRTDKAIQDLLRQSFELEGQVVSEQQANDPKYPIGQKVGYEKNKPTKKSGQKPGIANIPTPELDKNPLSNDPIIRRASRSNSSYSNVYYDEETVSEKCWVGYKQVGMKKKGGKVVPNCVKEGYSNWREELSEDWQKVNKKDKTDGMSQKAVDAYRRENPGSKLKTAVTEKNPGGKRAKRRKSFCARSNGQRKMHNIDCSKTPDKAICKARKRWRC